MKIKRIQFGIVNGMWKEKKYSKKGMFTYPTVITKIEDKRDKKIYVPFSNKDLYKIVRAHAVKELFKDKKHNMEKSQYEELKDVILSVFNQLTIKKGKLGEKNFYEEIEKEVEKMKEKGGFIEDLDDDKRFSELLKNGK